MTLLHQAAQKAVEALKLADGALCQASPCMWKDCKQEQMEWLAAARESIATNLAALESALQQQPELVAEDPKWVLLSRPGMSAQRKGPFRDGRLVEQMLRDLYELYPDATCLVVDAPHTTYPEDGREWVAMFGDQRRKRIPPALQQQEEPREPVAGLETLRTVIAFLRADGRYVDDEGEATDQLEDLLHALAAYPSTTRQQEVGSDIVEAIARQWDGCMVPMFDATGNPTDALDIGATIRADGIPAAAGWRPIATVPKDGREIILREGSRVGAACWVEWPDTHDNDGAPNSDGGEGWTVGYDGNEWRNPTAWQPLPAAPSTPEKAGGVSDGVGQFQRVTGTLPNGEATYRFAPGVNAPDGAQQK